jgi:hypothetical protein
MPGTSGITPAGTGAGAFRPGTAGSGTGPREPGPISSPAREPTTVPLMRMNCRSRPMCASIFRVVCSASQPATVSVIREVISRR